MTMATETFSGPLSFVVFAFDLGSDCGPGLGTLLESVEQGRIEILDIETAVPIEIPQHSEAVTRFELLLSPVARSSRSARCAIHHWNRWFEVALHLRDPSRFSHRFLS